jgi:hypothetical protein
MFQEPDNYTDNDHFFFDVDKDLEIVCNAPKDKDGIFKIIELRNGKVTLVFIGYSNSGGLYNEIVNGIHHDKNPRKLGLTYQMLKDKTDAIDVYWFVTDPSDNRKQIQTNMLKNYIEQTGELPQWNK